MITLEKLKEKYMNDLIDTPCECEKQKIYNILELSYKIMNEQL